MTTFGAAIFLLLVLSGITWFLLGRYAKHVPAAKFVFLLALCVHVVATFAIYYADFYPVGKGDQALYHPVAELVASDFREGVFSAERISERLQLTSAAHWYPVLVGGVYALTVSDELIGMALNAWIAAVSVLLLFFLAFEISGSARGALWAGVAASFYPSHVYFGSLLLKDSFVILLALTGLFLAVKMIQRFSPRYAIAFGIALALLFHFRFYIGIALLYAFTLSWPFIQGLSVKQKARYGAFTLLSLGLIPSLFGYGYYAKDPILHYTRIDQIELYRESAYVFEVSPDASLEEQQKQEEGNTDSSGSSGNFVSRAIAKFVPGFGKNDATKKEERGISEKDHALEKENSGESTVIVEVGDTPVSFVRNYLVSFSFVALGPFPWHLTMFWHYFTLIETLPWWILLFLATWGVIRQRKKWRTFLPVLLFGLGTLAMLSLLIDNFGVYMRVRIPAFLALMVFLSIPFSYISVRYFYENTRNRWSGFHWLPSRR